MEKSKVDKCKFCGGESSVISNKHTVDCPVYQHFLRQIMEKTSLRYNTNKQQYIEKKIDVTSCLLESYSARELVAALAKKLSETDEIQRRWELVGGEVVREVRGNGGIYLIDLTIAQLTPGECDALKLLVDDANRLI